MLIIAADDDEVRSGRRAGASRRQSQPAGPADDDDALVRQRVWLHGDNLKHAEENLKDHNFRWPAAGA